MTFIETIEYEDADRNLKKIYDRVKGKDGQIDNILKSHSLRPHTLVGHMAIYKNVLHNSNNTLEKSTLEMVGTYVSNLNKCDYCLEHHFEGFKGLLKNDERAFKIKKALVSDQIDSEVFSKKEIAILNYSKKLTENKYPTQKADIDELRKLGLTDGEILEVNQVVSYFNYANRTVIGLGINIDGEALGMSPNDSNDPDNWNHS